MDREIRWEEQWGEVEAIAGMAWAPGYKTYSSILVLYQGEPVRFHEFLLPEPLTFEACSRIMLNLLSTVGSMGIGDQPAILARLRMDAEGTLLAEMRGILLEDIDDDKGD